MRKNIRIPTRRSSAGFTIGSVAVLRCAAVSFMVAALFTASALAASVHLIVAADTSEASGLGADVEADKRAMQRLFESHVPANQLRVQTIEGKQLSKQTILRAVDRMPVRRQEDVVVFYFTGHGAFDENEGQFFSLPGKQQLLRRTLEEAIIQKQPRSAVTISDCCAAGARYRGSLDIPKSIPTPRRVSPLFQHLLFDVRGLVSISSSAPGEVSLTRGDGKGSLFTFPLVQHLDGNAERRQSWSHVFTSVRERVERDFEVVTKKKGVDTNGNGKPDQWTQTAHHLLPNLLPSLGLQIAQVGERMEVAWLFPLSPAYHAGLNIGDQLLEINGRPVRSELEYSRLVDESPRGMRVKVRDPRSLQEREVTVTLNRF